MKDSASKQISVDIPYDLWHLAKQKGVNFRATIIEALSNKIQETIIEDLKKVR
ncbi:MAG: hypothetical protein WCQ96_05505 [Patescibacteria group bacterium]|jgi:post-segregation antitoxin (ccd killing protein)